MTCLAAPTAARGADWMFRATVKGSVVEGRPLAWSDSQVRLLARDGSLHDFSPKEAKNAKKTSPKYRPMSDSELRAQLYHEFDGRMEFTSTGHYLVVHPPGAGQAWAKRFEQVYRSLLSYVRVRGFRPREPGFPLVAVVLRSEAEYRRFLRSSGTTVLPGALGHYDHYTNRVILYDVTAGAGDWTETADTIIHEATHQVAFNVGVHSRATDMPYWVPEGLAMLFEPRAVWDARGSDRREDRINAGRLADFRYYSKEGKPPFTLAEFAASDQPFKRSGTAAYAQAWTLAFYLAETRPREYSRYPRHDRRPFALQPLLAVAARRRLPQRLRRRPDDPRSQLDALGRRVVRHWGARWQVEGACVAPSTCHLAPAHGASFFSLRCSVRLGMPSCSAARVMLPPQSASTCWMWFHSASASDGAWISAGGSGFDGSSSLRSASARRNASRTWSASAGFVT